ncbi:hypothetical protein N0B44_21105 [Roseibacterium beibuensis]|uniref:hypothetical protein n=1 Tax=[Roseibacterium] beibuensis TaxID=1193142 RepID=UPI00217F051E|nr:hypothetical protein [Roseibacterium beibuensis]MCS6625414.1 hypothetical protein [Roseibacterium beibuensis]
MNGEPPIDPIDRHIGARLRAERRRRGLSLALLAAVALGCAVSHTMRDRTAPWAFPGSAARASAILIGAMMLWQVVGVELAIIVAGEVLTYIEVVTKVTLAAAGSRLRSVKAQALARISCAASCFIGRTSALSRPARTARAIRRKASRSDNDGDGRTPLGWVIAQARDFFAQQPTVAAISTPDGWFAANLSYRAPTRR